MIAAAAAWAAPTLVSAQCFWLWHPGDRSVESTPTAMAAGDFGGDCREELAVGLYSPARGGRVIRLLQAPDAAWTDVVSEYFLGSSGSIPAMARGDFNHDGHSDLAVGTNANQGGGMVVRLLLGNGNYGFSEAGEFSIGSGLTALAAGDFNGDGLDDLAVGTYDAPSGGSIIRILSGNATSWFAVAANYPLGGSGPYSLASGDFNRDGLADLAVGAYFSGSVVRVLLSTGSWLTPIGDYPIGGTAHAIATADFDGDAKQDLAYSTYSNGSIVRAALGDGSGGFSTVQDFTLSGTAFALAAGDAHGDHRIDLAFGASSNGAVVRTLANAGSIGIDCPVPSVRICPHGVADLPLIATGIAPFAFRWQIWSESEPAGWTDLADGPLIIDGVVWGTLSGSSTSTLRAQPDPLTYYVGGVLRFRAIVTSPCGTATSDDVVLTVCAADTDDGSETGTCDGGVTIDDLLYYLQIFELGDLAADIDDGGGAGRPDGGLTIDDLLYYLARFEAGC